jgi:putative Mg2+ transporter-C (MgtC) family protein
MIASPACDSALADAHSTAHQLETAMPPWWSQIITTVSAEFSDIPDVAEFTRVLLRLLIAVLLGAAIGYDRERNASPAGLRTHMLVALGSALFIVGPQQAGFDAEAVSRVVQGLIAGIGFLGAGTIIKLNEKEQVKGLTTAASVWATASIGVAAGMGREATAVLATVLVLVILAVIPMFERREERRRGTQRTPDENSPPPT